MITSPDLDILLLLTAVAAVAGFIDAIAGGGGLLSIPALLWAGLPPVQALATNKLQAVFGSLTATLNFMHKGVLALRPMALVVGLTFVGSMLGAWVVQRLDSQLLQQLLPWLLIIFALYFLISPRVGDGDARQRIGLALFASTAAVGIGFYDGFFGPGTGSFAALAFVALLGFNLRKATAHAKLLNFTSNLAALLTFIAAGQVVWGIGLSMAIGQLSGAWLGSHLVLRHGTALIRPLLVTVSLLLALKLLLE